jgi:tyrosinase
MNVEINIAATDSQERTFLTWSPVKASARIIEADGAVGTVSVTLRNGGIDGGGRVVFDTVRSDEDRESLDIELPVDGTAVGFWVAGAFGHPSLAYGDSAIEAVASGTVVGRRELMVRIRKNAVKLTAEERDRFIQALGTLNDRGYGAFSSFRLTHVAQSMAEAHTYAAFTAWHRAYLLDLERALQEIDAGVALPYWRFDEPARALFEPEFMGMAPDDPNAGQTVQFPAGHPLEFWRTDEAMDPIERRADFDIDGAPEWHMSSTGPVGVIPQDETMKLGGPSDLYALFRRYEQSPHGPAHTSFEGPVNWPPTAAKDPLFFLLHANIDRLWALWQFLKNRRTADDQSSYSVAGRRRQPYDIGHKLDDTLWPWNQIEGDGTDANPRPEVTLPRPRFPSSPIVNRPSAEPTVREMIDYQGVYEAESLGFDYDDVPFEIR